VLDAGRPRALVRPRADLIVAGGLLTLVGVRRQVRAKA
jgi:hypothetical protein